MTKGYVYILSNPTMPGLVKVGFSRFGGSKRAAQLHTTSTATPFTLEWEIYCSFCEVLEKAAHGRLANCRVDGAREFFSCDPGFAAARILEAYIFLGAGVEIDLTAAESDDVCPEPEVIIPPTPADPELVARTIQEIRAFLGAA